MDKATPRPVRIAVAIFSMALVLAACQAEPARDAAGSIAEEGDLSVFRFQVGDCFNDPVAGTEEVMDVDAVPCSEPHDNEVYHLFDLADGPWPGDQTIESRFVDVCLPAFEAYVDQAYDFSEFYIYPITPTEQSWERDDREVVCVLYSETAQLIGSMEGSRR